MKTVGMLTCYMDNFGACLQAYALQHSIEKAGFSCEIVRYTPIRNLKYHSFPVRVGIKVRNHLLSYKIESYKYVNAQRAYFERFRKEYLKFGKEYYDEIKNLYENPPQYDCFVTGSDQIWNPYLYGNTNNKAYFLDFVPKDRIRVAYAPSIGLSEVPESCKAEMGKLIDQLDAVSVREQAGKNIVEKISNKECRVVLDPTLLLSGQEWMELMDERLIEKPYIFCYLFSEREYIGKFVEYASKQLGYEIVTIPFTKREYQSSYTKIKKAGPREFINLIKNAELVITDSFHATAFSINLNVPFYSLLRNSENEENNMNSRIFNILGMTGLENRLIDCEENFPEVISTEIDFVEANNILDARRNNDLLFLKLSLEGKKYEGDL